MLTGEVPKATVQKILALSLDKDGNRKPEFSFDNVKEVTGVGYSRAWLIIRRRELELTAPGLLVATNEIIAEARAAAVEAGNELEFDPLEVMGILTRKLRLENKGISWGEIAVRMDVPESLVRKVFRHKSGLKDRGLRIGKGGRWVYSDPTLYTEHRMAEGAAIPGDIVGRPTVAQLLNGEHKLNRKPFLSTVVAKRRKAAPKTRKAVSQPGKELVSAE